MQKLKSVKLKNIIRPLTMILIASLLLIYSSYAWIRRQWEPELVGDGIKIATGDSLAFIFDESAPEFGTSLNNMLGMNNFTFKSVSNATGESNTFVALQYDYKGVGYERYNVLDENDLANATTANSAIWTDLGRQHGYVELTFNLLSSSSSENAVSNVYIDPSSVIKVAEGSNYEVDPSLSVRISISFTTGETNADGTPVKETIIFASDNRLSDTKYSLSGKQKGVKVETLEGYVPIYAVEGQERCYGGDKDAEITTFTLANYPESSFDVFQATEELHHLSEYDGTNENYLFSMPVNTQKEITVRIWLEGTDPYCTDAISGNELDLLLKFAATTTTQNTTE